MRRAFFIVISLGFTVACGGSSDSGSGSGGKDGGAGSGGATGGSGGATGGSGGATGGSGGATGGSGGATGGAAGSGGATGGAAGSGGATGGTGGTAGSAGAPGPECTTDADCTAFSDCCTCTALSKTDPNPPACPILCIQDKCMELQLGSAKPSCQAGRCVAGFDCDDSKVTCKALTPVCLAGEVPSVKGNCWGPCVPAAECINVPSCSVCKSADACVSNVAQLGPVNHCVDVPAQCGGNATCACLGPSVCTGIFSACGDKSGVKGVTCSCPAC